MVPVELELKNFLSYGTEAPPLRFDRFGVACLSGGNGQGKSALLDAMTWAVWGEARKSSGRRKPDGDILRIGAQEMQVVFTFDTGGTRYRVERLYQESATGKTTSSDLEFQMWEPKSERWRALTGANQRETQKEITDAVGLDYDTFINSSFLLQGRSDEFTQKSPSERKEILTRILALGRYEALQDRARARWRTAKNEKQRAEAEVERLKEALQEVEAWKAERAEVEEQIEEQEDLLDDLRTEEKELTERLAELRAKKEEADSLEAPLQSLAERIERLEDDADELAGQIEEADALLAKSDEIQRDFRRYEELKKERDALDDKRERHRAVEKQIEQKRSKKKDKQNEAEKRLDRLDVQQESDRKALASVEEQLAKAPALKEKLAAAEEAADTLDALDAKRERRRELAEQIQEAAHAVESRHGELRARQEALHQQIADEKEALAESDGLPEKIAALEEEQERLAERKERREEIKEKGEDATARIEALRGQIEAREKEREKKVRALERLRSGEELGGQCPTCGTELDAEHRRRVAAEQEQEIADLREEIEAKCAAKAECEEERDALRADFAALEDEIARLEEQRETLATLREQKAQRRERKEALAERTEEAQALDRKIEEKDFGEKERARHRALKEKREEIDFDEEAFEEARAQAAQAEQLRSRLTELEEQQGRKEELEETLAEREEKIETLKEEIESGAVLGDLPGEIEDLEEKLGETGFEPERFEEVRRQLKELSDAGERMNRLVSAQDNRSSWKKRRDRIIDRIAEAEDEREKLKEKRQSLKEVLEEKPALEEKAHEKAEERRRCEETRSELQSRRGQLAERLDQAERDREALKEAKKEKQEAERRRALYQHLKTAFGKHGIPSLIIEETLPDIEERANRLLDRLTDGQMHVSLETLRDTQRGGTTETLEINISDAQGATRAYETYSGGEGFRVNFALRIALAQLMAERSGVRVRTLVIDEGFGTQDEEGIQNLVEAIQTVQDNFEKILVITHLEELKNAFPVRIEVEKDPALGSTFEVNGI
jgi:exonuclease SbcC